MKKQFLAPVERNKELEDYHYCQAPVHAGPKKFPLLPSVPKSPQMCIDCVSHISLWKLGHAEHRI